MPKKLRLALAAVFIPVLLIAGCSMVALSVISSTSSAASCTPNAAVALGPASDVQINTTGVIIAGQPMSAEQIDIARQIVGIASSRGLSARDALVALMVAMQESKLRNLPYGDRDSRGVFQQRTSQGWGTPQQILNPVYATNKFYDHLETVDNRDKLTLLEVAIKVQVPSREAYLSPSNYFPGWETPAAQILGTYIPSDPSVTPQQVSFDSACAAGGASSSAVETAIQAALSQIGRPYVWGGETPGGGFDCSGLMLWAFDKAGITLHRVASDQYNDGQNIERDKLERGDMVFWATDVSNPATIGHVALYLGNNQIIVAPHSGALVQVRPMYWDSGNEYFIGGTRVATPPNSQPRWQLPVKNATYTVNSGTAVGINLAADPGTPVYAASTGTVAQIGSEPNGRGNFVTINHNGGVQTEYAHLRDSSAELIVGGAVNVGQIIGHVGTTGAGFGSRLLLIVRVNGQAVDPVQFLREQGVRPQA